MPTTFRIFYLSIGILFLSPAYLYAQSSIEDNVDTAPSELSPFDHERMDKHDFNRWIVPDKSADKPTKLGQKPERKRRLYCDNDDKMPIKMGKLEDSDDASKQTPRYAQKKPVLLNKTDTSPQKKHKHDPPNKLHFQARPVKSSYGIGLRMLGFSSINSSASSNLLSGGGGFYIKLRPIRWVSISLTSDFIYDKSSSDDAYLRIPISLGLDLHVFDYGAVNVYGIAAASLSLYPADIDHFFDKTQYGGQFGIGASLIISAFEIGLDLRYTIDKQEGLYSRSSILHGLVFATYFGLVF